MDGFFRYALFQVDEKDFVAKSANSPILAFIYEMEKILLTISMAFKFIPCLLRLSKDGVSNQKIKAFLMPIWKVFAVCNA
ncbi:hypothetical protein M5689_019557 [Euphorbia peplus]|nr:hypothetical protein M5689_019557 [Euphorbia peplus]